MNVSYDVWTLDKLLEHFSNQIPCRYFKKFHFLRPRFKHSAVQEYSKATNLTPMELQPNRTLENIAYHRFVVGLENNEVVGAMKFEWTNRHSDFWHYYNSFIDVRSDKRGNGIARGLLRTTNSAEFIQNRILHMSSFREYTKGLEQVYREELQAKQYALLPPGFCVTITPVKPGVYDEIGRIKNSINESLIPV